MKKTAETIALLMSICLGAFASRADITTGWTNTTAGVQQFLEPDNWADGDINGVFSSGWSSSSSSTHVIRLTNDWTGTITFNGNIYKEITFSGYNAANTRAEARTITLTDDLVIQPAVSQYTDSRLTFDAYIGFDLGGVTRTFFGNSTIGGKLRFNGPISNGNLVIDGDGAIVSLLGAAAVDGDVTVRPNTTFAFDYPGSATLVGRAKDVELHRATLSVNARNSSDTACCDALTVTSADVPSMSILQVTHNNKVAVLSANSLSITNGGFLAVMASDLGAAEGATKASRVIFESIPATAGTGASGSVSVPVVLDVIAITNSTISKVTLSGTNAGSESGYVYANQPVLVTYDPTVGMRALAASETSEAVSAETSVNLVVPSATTLELDADAIVNSLQMRAGAYNTASQKITGNNTLTVQSGMVLVTPPKDGAKIEVALDFKGATGRLIAGGPKNYGVDLTKSVAGSRGLVFSRALQTYYDTTIEPSSNAHGFNVASSSGSTYTGDTYVQCIVEAGSSDFLPHGTRSGNTIVNGSLNFGSITLNGLYGTGAVRGTTLTVGEDGSDSLFAGTAVLTSALNVSGGNFILDGTVTQGAVNVASGAAIGGNGEIQTTLTFADGAKFDVDVADDVASCLNVTGAVTGGPVTVNANVTSGKWRTAQCVLKSDVAITATFNRGAGVGALELRNNGTELWASPKVSGFTIVFR